MRLALLLLAVSAVTPAIAAADKYGITAEEHAACDADVLALCAETIPDVDRTLACLKGKVAQLTPACAPVFRAGLKRRRIPL